MSTKIFFNAVVISDPHTAFPFPGESEVNVIVEITEAFGDEDVPTHRVQSAVAETWVPARGTVVGVINYPEFYASRGRRPRLYCPKPDLFERLRAEALGSGGGFKA